MQKSSLFLICLFIGFVSRSQDLDSATIFEHLRSGAKSVDLDLEVLNNPEYRLQFTFTQLEVNDSDTSFNTFYYGNNEYFYPASVVKFPLALLALEKMKRLGITMDDYYRIDAVGCGNQSDIIKRRGRRVKFSRLFEELIVVSDNYFYTLLYQFVTPKEINDALKKKGYSGTHIYKSFAGCEKEDQLKCYPVVILDEEFNVKYSQNYCEMDSVEMLEHYEYSEDRLFGSKHENDFVKIVPGPYDLNYNLEIPLQEANEMLIRLKYPNQFSESEKWNIREGDRAQILRMMQLFPNEINNPFRPKVLKYNDNKYKYALVGEYETEFEVRTTSKIGLSYGFTTEIMHFRIDEYNLEFFMSVSIYTNANDIVNDGDYEYESVARPFIFALSRALCSYGVVMVK